MKPVLLIALLAFSACTNPMLTTEMAVGTAGVSISPTLSGTVGGAIVSVQPN